MEKFDHYVAEADKAFKVADHLIYVTYPVLRDNKLLATALEHLHRAFQNGMAALLYYDALYKRNSVFPTEFGTQLHLFKQSSSLRHGIGSELCQVIAEVADLIQNRRESPIEFSRKDKYIIASQTYKLRTLTVDKMKRYLSDAKTFIHRVNEIHATHDRRTN